VTKLERSALGFRVRMRRDQCSEPALSIYSMLFRFRTIFFLPSATKFRNFSPRASSSAPSTEHDATVRRQQVRAIHFAVRHLQCHVDFLPANAPTIKTVEWFLNLSKPDEKGWRYRQPLAASLSVPVSFSEPLVLPKPPWRAFPQPALLHSP
jgi:hypothetical protein